MTLTNLIGYPAAVVGTFLMVPQLVKSLRVKHMDDVSGIMLGMYVLNCALWLSYGILLHAAPLILCNAIALCIGVFQMGLKWKYSKPRTQSLSIGK
jgi:MtN3 and saliva related transmembrane protein